MHISWPYTEIWDRTCFNDNRVDLRDHLGGFDSQYNNEVLTELSKKPQPLTVQWHQIINDDLRKKYPRLDLKFSPAVQNRINLSHFHSYVYHDDRDLNRFLCSFNGTVHVGRKLLVATLQRFGWFDPETCSKNFVFTTQELDGHISALSGSDRLYRKFFLYDQAESFFQTRYSFGHARFAHRDNIYHLQNTLKQSFLHIVSETMPTSYYPFVTEKFLYSVVTRGLFLAYAQPGWHDHLEKYYGFKTYSKIFNYRFDVVQDPIVRLIELMSMIAKFAVLSSDDWHDLYAMESETLAYNHDHYFSKKYIDCLQQC